MIIVQIMYYYINILGRRRAKQYQIGWKYSMINSQTLQTPI